MKFAAAVLLGVVLFADLSEAHRSKKKHRHGGGGGKKRGERLSCKYVADADDKTSARFMIAVGQKASDEDPNPNAVKIGGSAKNFTATVGDVLTLNSFDAAACTGTKKAITTSSPITATERTCKKNDTTYMTAKIPKTEDTTKALLASYASFQLVGADGSQLMCCDTAAPSTRMLYADFLLN